MLIDEDACMRRACAVLGMSGGGELGLPVMAALATGEITCADPPP